MNQPRILSLATLTLAVLLTACSSQSDDSRSTVPPPMPAADTPAAGEATPIEGKVVETIDSGGYTYVLLDTGSGEVWAATRELTLTPGEVVVVEQPMPMEGWRSSTLERTFELVYFSESIHPPGEAAGGADSFHGSIHGGAPAPSPEDVELSGIEAAEGGVTVEEIFRKRTELVGTEIAIRGKVVKYNGGILGKNWLHLRDGTGEEGTNDLTITTDAEVAVGDIVLVRGKLNADRDFGAGYQYDLIVEDAKVTKE